jgi:flavin-dependent dehydrogenase
MQFDVAIVGGGLAGLVNAYLLAKEDYRVVLFEKKSYPFHRVCGEYISNEVIPFLEHNDLFPDDLDPVSISRFRLTSLNGKSLHMPLDLGGFGVSRYGFDNFLYKRCLQVGVDFRLKTTVENIGFKADQHEITVKGGECVAARVVIGAYGKRSSLDRQLDRKFMKSRSPYLGVKYHITTDYPEDLITLHNFRGGYCGVSRVEDDKVNLCYLASRNHLLKHGSIEKMEGEVLFENPHLKELFRGASFIFDKPVVINEISFATKTPIEAHILMSGDSAGMVTPLCGNGMAIAIRSARLLSELVAEFLKGAIIRHELEAAYAGSWSANFQKRLWAGRKIQSLFGKYNVSNFAVAAARASRGFGIFLMQQTHGKPFQ